MSGVRVAVDVCAELAIPLQSLGVVPGDGVTFSVIVSQLIGGALVELDRVPRASQIRVTVPGAAFTAEQWRA